MNEWLRSRLLNAFATKDIEKIERYMSVYFTYFAREDEEDGNDEE